MDRLKNEPEDWSDLVSDDSKIVEDLRQDTCNQETANCSSRDPDLFLGLDLSTQQLKAIVISSPDLAVVAEEHVIFSDALPDYGTTNGVLSKSLEKEVFAPVKMWLEALDLLVGRLQARIDLSRLRCISGAGQQHGSVYWSRGVQECLKSLSSMMPLAEQLCPQALSWPFSPNWQDASTARECDEFDALLQTRNRKDNDGEDQLARITGSKAHHRFTGPQILRFRRLHTQEYSQTAGISLVSSFLATIFLGDENIASIDAADAAGMNLYDVHSCKWHPDLLALCTGKDPSHPPTILGHVNTDLSQPLGPIGPYWVDRGFSSNCMIAPFTGDNPATLLALPLAPLDAIVSLGTSTTFLMVTPTFAPSPAYHLFPHPTDPNLWMFMLCIKNGSLAREEIRNSLPPPTNDEIKRGGDPWERFTSAVLAHADDTPSRSAPVNVGVYFPQHEIVPDVQAGTWRLEYDPTTSSVRETSWPADLDPFAILTSQLLSLRLRSAPLLSSSKNGESGRPATPRRIYLAGGAARNEAVQAMVGRILGGSEGVYVLKEEVGGNACALGAATRAAWTMERKEDEGFEEWLKGRWREEEAVRKVDEGYRESIWEGWERGVEALRKVEEELLRRKAGGTVDQGD